MFFKIQFLVLPLYFLSLAGAQDTEWVSPCPRLFVYEGQKSNETDRWYGIITLLSDTELTGIWLRVLFDSPSLQLGNWFGQVVTSDNKDYLIKNRNHVLKAHVPQTIRFYLKYDPNGPIPKLAGFRLNARTVCPDGVAAETPPPTPELQTSGPDPNNPGPNSGGGGSRPGSTGGGSNTGASRPDFFRPTSSPTGSNEDDDVYPGDFFNFFNRPSSGHKKPVAETTFDLNAVCGTVIAQPRPLITYGQSTNEGEFPWHAALYHAKGIDLAYICGASLVSKNHVITVSHCVTKQKSPAALNPDNLVVYLGKYFLKRFSSPGIQDRQVSKIVVHPQYNPQTYSNDIAILKLLTPADITDYVRPICLWQGSADLNSVLNKQGSVVGWGFDETGKVTEQLMQAKMPVVSQATCLQSFPDFYSRFTTDTTYCAGFRNGTSVCNGDSGGGMVFPKANSNRNNPVWQLRGLVSISVALQNQFKCDTSHYVVFTDAAKYSEWIKKALKE